MANGIRIRDMAEPFFKNYPDYCLYVRGPLASFRAKYPYVIEVLLWALMLNAFTYTSVNVLSINVGLSLVIGFVLTYMSIALFNVAVDWMIYRAFKSNPPEHVQMLTEDLISLVYSIRAVDLVDRKVFEDTGLSVEDGDKVAVKVEGMVNRLQEKAGREAERLLTGSNDHVTAVSALKWIFGYKSPSLRSYLTTLDEEVSGQADEAMRLAVQRAAERHLQNVKRGKTEAMSQPHH